MKKLLFGAAFLLLASSAFAAETIKATVGHMCCGSCKASATAGVKTLDWVNDVAIDGTTMTVTAKDGQRVDVAALLDALRKTGFPANEVMVSGPVTMTVGHMCCQGCVNDLKGKLGEIKSNRLDKANVRIDLPSKTVVLAPVAGQTMNLIPILHQMDDAGFAAVKCTIGTAAATK